MNFKDKKYYAGKLKEYASLIASALVFDIIVLVIILL